MAREVSSVAHVWALLLGVEVMVECISFSGVIRWLLP